MGVQKWNEFLIVGIFNLTMTTVVCTVQLPSPQIKGAHLSLCRSLSS